MERKRFSVLFFIKRSKLLKNGEAPVRVRVTYDRLYVELQLKRSVKVPLWSQEKEKSTGKDRNSVELNHYIDALIAVHYGTCGDNLSLQFQVLVNLIEFHTQGVNVMVKFYGVSVFACRLLFFLRPKWDFYTPL